MRFVAIVLTILTLACSTSTRIPPTPQVDRTTEFIATCTDLWGQETGLPITVDGLNECLGWARGGKTGEEIRAIFHATPEAIAFRTPPPKVDAGERGRLRVVNRAFVREDGSIFQWRG